MRNIIPDGDGITSGGFHWAPRHGPGIIRREGDEDFITGGSFDGISSTERIITGGIEEC